MSAWNGRQPGSVIVNGIPSFRVDNMPHDGIKLSGCGCGGEGARYAIEAQPRPA